MKILSQIHAGPDLQGANRGTRSGQQLPRGGKIKRKHLYNKGLNFVRYFKKNTGYYKYCLTCIIIVNFPSKINLKPLKERELLLHCCLGSKKSQIWRCIQVSIREQIDCLIARHPAIYQKRLIHIINIVTIYQKVNFSSLSR